MENLRFAMALSFLHDYNIKIPGKRVIKNGIFCIDIKNVYCIIDQLYAKEKKWC